MEEFVALEQESGVRVSRATHLPCLVVASQEVDSVRISQFECKQQCHHVD